jgi:hypothetical protein
LKDPPSEGQRIVIPNAVLFTNPIVVGQWPRKKKKQLRWKLDSCPDDDIRKAHRKVLTETADIDAV